MGEVQRKVRVELGPDSYEIIIGRNLNAELQEFVKGAGFSQKALLLTDSKVGKIYGEKVCHWLKEAGLEAALVTVPAGESEARRYWVLNADCPVNFENTAEAESALRAAAHDTLAALEAHADKYDRLTVVGKIWVQSPNEERETAERNGAHKAQNASTVALNAGLFALKDILNTQSPWPRALFSASMWGAVFETGDALRIGGPRTWTPPKCKAADIAKMITDRCKRRVTTIKDNGVRKRTAGYSLLDLVYEFLNDYKQDAVSYRDGFDFADITDNQGPNGMHFV